MTDWQIGMLAFRQGRLREAADRLATASEEQERAVSQEVRLQTFAFLGAALYALGNAAGALAAFQAAARLSSPPGPPIDLMVNLANAYLANGLRREAQATLEQAIQASPGAMDARLLLERLQDVREDAPLTGSVLGASPESVQRFLSSLSFATISQGYAPEQVRAALDYIRHYVETLSAQFDKQERTIAEQAAEIERMRQSEEAIIDSMMQARQEADRLRQSAAQDEPEGRRTENNANSGSALTPLDKLFQKKA